MSLCVTSNVINKEKHTNVKWQTWTEHLRI